MDWEAYATKKWYITQTRAGKRAELWEEMRLRHVANFLAEAAALASEEAAQTSFNDSRADVSAATESGDQTGIAAANAAERVAINCLLRAQCTAHSIAKARTNQGKILEPGFDQDEK